MHQRCRMPAHASTAASTAAPARVTAAAADSTADPARVRATPTGSTAGPATDEAGRAFA
ncbi:hypothetical protein AB0D10_02565 [Kitasatospora sp. NPDC048545]|uniref:hypothetical protein n=1 Tax=unclassified Kitasatospora TaxID=2633591 RepID=UPI00340DA5F6